MTPLKPPRLASALLDWLAPTDAACRGDLDEAYRQGRSGVWYWRQVIGAILAGGVREIQTHPVAVVRSLATGWIVAWALSYYVVPVALDFDRWLFERGFGWFYLQGHKLHLDPSLVVVFANALGGCLSVRSYGGQRPLLVVGYTGTIVCANAILFARWFHYASMTPPLVFYTPFQIATMAVGAIPAAALLGGLWAARTQRSSDTAGVQA